MFEQDVLPYVAPVPDFTGERRLLIAVLGDVKDTLCSEPRTPQDKFYWVEAYWWVFGTPDPTDKWYLRIEQVCALLGTDLEWFQGEVRHRMPKGTLEHILQAYPRFQILFPSIVPVCMRAQERDYAVSQAS